MNKAKRNQTMKRKTLLNYGITVVTASSVLICGAVAAQAAAQTSAEASARQARKPNILVIFGDDIGQANISVFTKGLMGYRTPNIDRLAREGALFTDYYAEQSSTAGRSS